MQINSNVPVQTFLYLKTISVSEIVEICKKYKVDLVDVAQDNVIEAGLVNNLIKENFNVVCPTRETGQIEWDKAWARDFMKKYKIPLPFYKVFNSYETAKNFVRKNPEKRFFYIGRAC